MLESEASLPPGYLQTLDRGLQVLLAFGDQERDLGVSDVARRFGWDKAVAQRVLATLAHRGFLTVDQVSRRYRLGPATISLGQLAIRSGALTRVALPLLARLTRATGESAVLSVRDGADYRCEAAVDGRGPISYSAIVGSSLPGHGGAAGHAIFAFLPRDEVDVVMAGDLARFTDTTLTTLTALRPRYTQVRTDGYAVSHGEYDPDAAAVAAPVWSSEGVVAASLAAIGPRQRVTAAEDVIIPAVLAEAEALSAAISGRPPAVEVGQDPPT